MLNQKSPRKFLSDDIADYARRTKYPDMGSYTKNYKRVDGKVLGCFSFQGDRSGYLEEAALIGK